LENTIMRPIHHWLRSTAVAGLALLGGTMALSQQPERKDPADAPRRARAAQEADRADDSNRSARTERREQGERSERAAGQAPGDASLAACLIIDNHKEIALAPISRSSVRRTNR
jgi:hypothetical protein